MYFWDFARTIWAYAGSEKGTEHVWVISRDVGLALGGVLEWVFWAMGRQSKLTRRQVKYSSMTRYYSCGKARQRLGYEPIVGLNEGLRRGVKWFEDQRTKEVSKKDQ